MWFVSRISPEPLLLRGKVQYLWFFCANKKLLALKRLKKKTKMSKKMTLEKSETNWGTKEKWFSNEIIEVYECPLIKNNTNSNALDQTLKMCFSI